MVDKLFCIIILFLTLCSLPITSFQIQSETDRIAKKDSLVQYEEFVGKWFVPHIADIHLTLNKDKTFIFDDFCRQSESLRSVCGSYEIRKNTLILLCKGGRRRIFKIKKGENADEYIIGKGIYYFVKEE